MREIRFRSWNKVHKKMEICPVVGGIMGISFNKPLMQYTGLEDKNGVEIYEGDIYAVDNEGKYQVMFVGGAFVGGKDRDSCVPLAWEGEDFDWPWSNAQTIEVIGNIYENPELLESK